MSIKGKYNIDPKESRVYKKDNSAIFKKNNEEFGGLSNMATGFPLKINSVEIKTAEALYQACRFPHMREIQEKIIDQKSPMNVKMISNANKKNSREDWDIIRIKVMKWCINIKIAQNFIKFGTALHETGLKNIVENSSNDNFWGAIPNEDGTIFSGKNALGRLLMDLRQTFYGKDSYSLLYVEPPLIENFLIFNEPIGIIDERQNFIRYLQDYWKDSENIQKNKQTNIFKDNQVFSQSSIKIMSVEEETEKYGIPGKQKRKTKSKKAYKDSQSNLFNIT